MMKTLLNRISFFDAVLFAPDEGAGGGDPSGGAPSGGPGGGAPSGDPPAGAAPPDPGSAPAGAAPGSPPAPSAGTPSAAPGPAAGGDLYKPDGLADSLLGKTNTETIDNMAKALAGYRERDAGNKVPETAEAYGQFGDDMPAEVKPYLETLANDPITGRMQQYALENRIPLPVYQGMVKQFLSVGSELGLMEPVIDEAKERAELVPETARHLSEGEQKAAREKRMNENFAYLDAAVAKGLDPTTKQFDAKRGGISAEDAEYAKSMLGDSAKGHRFLEWVRALGGGMDGGTGGPGMQQPGGGGQNERDALRAELALPENTIGNPKFDRKSYEAVQARYQKLLGS
ncbi:hypothetical protein [Rhizobium sp. PAMB 3182]